MSLETTSTNSRYSASTQPKVYQSNSWISLTSLHLILEFLHWISVSKTEHVPLTDQYGHHSETNANIVL